MASYLVNHHDCHVYYLAPITVKMVSHRRYFSPLMCDVMPMISYPAMEWLSGQITVCPANEPILYVYKEHVFSTVHTTKRPV